MPERRIRVLYDEAAIAQRNAEIARAVADSQPKDLLVVAVLKGSFMFAADLIRAMHRVGLAPQVEFIHLSSYRTGTVSTGQVEILRDVQSDRASNKKTLTVRLGERFGRFEIAFAVLAPFVAIAFINLYPLIALPLAALVLRCVWRAKGRAFNRCLAMVGALQWAFAILFVIGCRI